MSEPMQAAGDLRTELVDGVLTLTLDRPHAPMRSRSRWWRVFTQS
jgi:hypothetical protein